MCRIIGKQLMPPQDDGYQIIPGTTPSSSLSSTPGMSFNSTPYSEMTSATPSSSMARSSSFTPFTMQSATPHYANILQGEDFSVAAHQ